MLNAIGFTEDDLKKPIIGIANTWTETMPCNFNLRAPGREGERGRARRRRHADGVQHHRHQRRRHDGHRGHEGIAGQPRSHRRLHRTGRAAATCSTRMVAIVACDKTIPGAPWPCCGSTFPASSSTAARFCRANSRAATSRSWTSSKARRTRRPARSHDQELEELEDIGLPRRGRVRRPVHRQHHGHGDGVVGPRRDGQRERPAEIRARKTSAAHAGAMAMKLRRAANPPAIVVNTRAHSKTRSPQSRRPVARPTRCCTCSRSRRRPVSTLAMDDSIASAAEHRSSPSLKPGRQLHRGRSRSWRAARASSRRAWSKGVSSIAGDHRDVAARSPKKRRSPKKLRARRSSFRQVAPSSQAAVSSFCAAHWPLKARDQSRRLRANLPPGAGTRFRLRRGRIGRSQSPQDLAGDVVVIRYEGPRGGPGMREMLGVTAAIVGARARLRSRARNGWSLQRRYARSDGRPRGAGSGRRRTDRRGAGRRHHHARYREA